MTVYHSRDSRQDSYVQMPSHVEFYGCGMTIRIKRDTEIRSSLRTLDMEDKMRQQELKKTKLSMTKNQLI